MPIFLRIVEPYPTGLASGLRRLYEGEDGRFQVSTSCVTISNPEFAFQQWNRCWSWFKKMKKHWSEWARCQEDIGGIYLTKKWRAETLQPSLEFVNFKPRHKSGIFKCISWLNGSFLEGDDRDTLKEGFKTYLKAPMSSLNSPKKILFPQVHIHNLWGSVVRWWISQATLVFMAWDVSQCQAKTDDPVYRRSNFEG